MSCSMAAAQDAIAALDEMVNKAVAVFDFMYGCEFVAGIGSCWSHRCCLAQSA